MQNSIEFSILDSFENLKRKPLGNFYKIGTLFNEHVEYYLNCSLISNKEVLENTTLIEINNFEMIEILKNSNLKEKLQALQIPDSQAISIIKESFKEKKNCYHNYLMNSDCEWDFSDYHKLHFTFICINKIKKQSLDYLNVDIKKITNLMTIGNATHFIGEITYGLNFIINFYMENSLFECNASHIFQREKIEKGLLKYLRNLNFKYFQNNNNNENVKNDSVNVSYKDNEINDSEFNEFKKYIRVKLTGDCIPVEYSNFISLDKLKNFFQRELKLICKNLNDGKGLPINYTLTNIKNLNLLGINSLKTFEKNVEKSINQNSNEKFFNNFSNLTAILNIYSEIKEIENLIREKLTIYRLIGEKFFKMYCEELSNYYSEIKKIEENLKEFLIENYEFVNKNSFPISFINTKKYKKFKENISAYENDLASLKEKIKIHNGKLDRMKIILLRLGNLNYKLINKEFNFYEYYGRDFYDNNKKSIILNIPSWETIKQEENALLNNNITLFKKLYDKYNKMLHYLKYSKNKDEVSECKTIEDFLCNSIFNFHRDHLENKDKFIIKDSEISFFINFKNNAEKKDENLEHENTGISFYYNNELVYTDLKAQKNFFENINKKLNLLSNYDNKHNKTYKIIESYEQFENFLKKPKDKEKHDNNIYGCLFISKEFFQQNENASNYELDVFRNLKNDLDLIKNKKLAVIEYEKLMATKELMKDLSPSFYKSIKTLSKFMIFIFHDNSLLSDDYTKDKLIIKEILKIFSENPNRFQINLNIYELYKYYGKSVYIFLYGSSLFHRNQKAFYENLKLFKQLINDHSINPITVLEKEKQILICKNAQNTNHQNENKNLCCEKKSNENKHENISKSNKSKRIHFKVNNNNCIHDNNQNPNHNQVKDEFIKSENFNYVESDETENSREISCCSLKKGKKFDTSELIHVEENSVFFLLNYEDYPYSENEYFYDQFLNNTNIEKNHKNKNLKDNEELSKKKFDKNNQLETIKDSQENHTHTFNENNSNQSDATIRSENFDSENDESVKINEHIDKTVIFYVFPNGEKCSDYLKFYYKEKIYLEEKNKMIYKLAENDINSIAIRSKTNLEKKNSNTLINAETNNFNNNNNSNRNFSVLPNKISGFSNVYIQEKKSKNDIDNFNQNSNLLINKNKNFDKYNLDEYKYEIRRERETNSGFVNKKSLKNNPYDNNKKSFIKKNSQNIHEKYFNEDVDRNSLYENLDFDFTYYNQHNKKTNNKKFTNKSLKKVNNQEDLKSKDYLEDYKLGRKRSSSYCNKLLQSNLRTIYFNYKPPGYKNFSNKFIHELKINNPFKKDGIEKMKGKDDEDRSQLKNLKVHDVDEFFLPSSPEDVKPNNSKIQNSFENENKINDNKIKKVNQGNVIVNKYKMEENHKLSFKQSSEINLKKISKKDQPIINNPPFHSNVNNNIQIPENFTKQINADFFGNNNMNNLTPYNLPNLNPNETNFINETNFNNLINETGTVSILNTNLPNQLNLQEIFKLDFIRQNETLENDNPLGCVKIINEKFIATGDSRNLKLWNIEENEIVYVFHGHTDFIYHIEVLKNEPDEVTVASASSDGLIKIWDFIGFVNVLTISPNIGYISCIVLLNANPNISNASDIICGGDSKVKIYDYKTGIERKQIRSKSNMPYIGNIVFNKDCDNELFIASKFGNSNKIEKMKLDEEFSEIFYENNSNIASLADIVDFVNEKSSYYKRMMLIFGDKNGKIKLLCKETKNILQIYYGHLNRIEFLKQIHLKNSKETLFVSCCYDNSVKIWSLEQPNYLKSLEGHHYAVWMCDELEYEDNFMIVTVSSDKKIIKWSCDL